MTPNLIKIRFDDVENKLDCRFLQRNERLFIAALKRVSIHTFCIVTVIINLVFHRLILREGI